MAGEASSLALKLIKLLRRIPQQVIIIQYRRDFRCSHRRAEALASYRLARELRSIPRSRFVSEQRTHLSPGKSIDLNLSPQHPPPRSVTTPYTVAGSLDPRGANRFTESRRIHVVSRMSPLTFASITAKTVSPPTSSFTRPNRWLSLTV